jgi:hypothetical protein
MINLIKKQKVGTFYRVHFLGYRSKEGAFWLEVAAAGNFLILGGLCYTASMTSRSGSRFKLIADRFFPFDDFEESFEFSHFVFPAGIHVKGSNVVD